jgi:hypothetical protein
MPSMAAIANADAAEFMQRCHAALKEHTGGHPRPFLELWSRAGDVSLMGAWAAIRSA